MPIKTIHRGGRPRQPDRRRDTTTGRSRGESPAEVVAVALAQRIKGGADPDDALNALHASTLGVLHRLWQMCATDPSGISPDQYNAALAYISCVTRYCELMGIPLPRPFAGGSAGATRRDPSEEVVLAVRRRFADLRRTLLDCGAEIGVGSRVNAAVYRICIEDPSIDAVQPAEIENLRYGLNAVARSLR